MLAIIFRLFPKYGVTNLYAIITNYFTCFLIGSSIHGSSTFTRATVSETWFPYALFLSLTFILFFNVNAFTLQKVGMIITSVFQKLSLVAPVILGLLFFGEVATALKILAIILTVIAIILINYTDKDDTEMVAKMKQYWYWPLLVFFGSGLIEATLFYAEVTGKINNAGLEFTSTLFLMAGVWGLLFMLITRKTDVKRNDIIGGVLIGIPNFFTIYLIMKGLEVGYEGSVLFPVNNVGTIFLTAIVGIFFFSEKLNLANKLGLALALVSVVLIS